MLDGEKAAKLLFYTLYAYICRYTHTARKKSTYTAV